MEKKKKKKYMAPVIPLFKGMMVKRDPAAMAKKGMTPRPSLENRAEEALHGLNAYAKQHGLDLDDLASVMIAKLTELFVNGEIPLFVIHQWTAQLVSLELMELVKNGD